MVDQSLGAGRRKPWPPPGLVTLFRHDKVWASRDLGSELAGPPLRSGVNPLVQSNLAGGPGLLIGPRARRGGGPGRRLRAAAAGEQWGKTSDKRLSGRWVRLSQRPFPRLPQSSDHGWEPRKP